MYRTPFSPACLWHQEGDTAPGAGVGVERHLARMGRTPIVIDAPMECKRATPPRPSLRSAQPLDRIRECATIRARSFPLAWRYR
jgi:hypothetical protein